MPCVNTRHGAEKLFFETDVMLDGFVDETVLVALVGGKKGIHGRSRTECVGFPVLDRLAARARS